ncbi:hypothetical protein Tco_0506853, partial [Tanacetum coccineum]
RWSMDASDLTCTEVMALRTQVVAQQSEIAETDTVDRGLEIAKDTTNTVDGTSKSTGTH